VNDAAAPSPLPLKSAALGEDIAAMQADIERIIQVAGLKNDPILPLIQVMSLALGLQWRLHDQAVSYFHDASERLDHQLADTIRQGELALATRREAIVEKLAPQLIALVETTARQNQKTLRLKTVLFGAATLIGVLLVGGSLTFASGYAEGRTNGEVIGHTVNAAMAFGPDAAAAWSSLMAYNDPVPALATCKKSSSTDSDGRRYCMMPVWIGPPQPAKAPQ